MPMKKPLTIARIQTAKVPDGAAELKLWDGAISGLCLRCFAGGGRTWVYRYRADGGGRSAKIRTLKLGTFPALSLGGARSAARAHAGQVASGQDPAQQRQETRRRETAALGTLLAVNGPYERSLRARHYVKREQVLSCLRRGLDRLKHVDIAKLTRRDLVDAIDALGDRPGAQVELRKCTRVLLEWAVNSGLAPANCLAGWRAPQQSRAQKLKAVARRRALTDSDIIAVWAAAEQHGTFGALVRLALLTGMRRNELATLRWDDIKSDRIVLEAAVTKTSTRQEVPLTARMRSVLNRQPRTTSPLVFPSSVTNGVMTGWGWLKTELIREAGAGHFTLHDMRRTCRTLMSRLGVVESVAELAIGHVKEALVATYDLDSQWNARCDAFDRVSGHIGGLISE
jgi:integrase